MSAGRDELLSDIAKADSAADYDDGWHQKAADAVLAAGYRRPRTVTTAAEFDALGFNAVVEALREYPGLVYARADVALPQVSAAVLTAAYPHLRRAIIAELVAKAKAASEHNRRGFISRTFDGTPMPDISDAAGAARWLHAELEEVDGE